jgi:hypothetical protein
MRKEHRLDCVNIEAALYKIKVFTGGPEKIFVNPLLAGKQDYFFDLVDKLVSFSLNPVLSPLYE